jgi:medium-chain acyl-[acyl-carrier-protein] hydrolase
MLLVRQAAERSHRIVAFPFAGGGASSFSRLREQLTDCELIAVQLPGREERHEETPYIRVRQVIDACLDCVDLFDERPYALMGYSLGARLAFHLTRALIDRGNRPPSLLILCACPAPPATAADAAAPARARDRPIYELPDAEFIERMQIFGGMPSDLTPEQRALVLPKLRADLRLLEDCLRAGVSPVNVPLLMLGGRNDPSTPRPALERWAELTTSGADTHLVSGGHFFLFQPPYSGVSIIEDRIRAVAIGGVPEHAGA